MDEIEIRKLAVTRCLSGESPKQVAQSLKRTKQWVYKWLRRYRSGNEDWYLSKPKTPKTVYRKIAPSIEAKILEIRKTLSETKYAQIGAISIQYEFLRLGIEPPQIWTINRVLKKHGVIKQSKKRISKNIDYPELFISTHQMDLVGPRYLSGGLRFYVLNIIDIETRTVHVHPIPDKRAISILEGILTFWKTFGIPDALQMDNELAFRGSNRYPRNLGIILRFVLSQGVVPVFIPIKEPWRNGIIEKFNDKFDKMFYRVQKFNDFEHLKVAAKEFEEFHNQNHRYSSQANKTPEEMLKEIIKPFKLVKNYKFDSDYIPDTGSIIFIRFVRSNLQINVFNTIFKVKKELMYTYVTAHIILEHHCLLVKQDNIVHHIFTFVMPNNIGL